MRKAKRIASMLLVMVLLFAQISLNVFAAESDSYVGKNSMSKEEMFELIGFASTVGSGNDKYFDSETAASAGTVFWFLNMSDELQECVNEDGYVDTTYDYYMAIAEAYFVNVPKMDEYLSKNGYMNSETKAIYYYLGGLGDCWSWELCEVHDGGETVQLKGIFCSGEVSNTEGLTEYVDYYDGLYIDSAVELTVVENEEHGWLISSYEELDYYLADTEETGETFFVYNEQTDSFSNKYYKIVDIGADGVYFTFEEGTYTRLDGVLCYSDDMEPKWTAECSEGYTCQVKETRIFNGEERMSTWAENGIIYGGGSVELRAIPVCLFTIEAQNATVEVLNGLTDMGDGTYAYLEEGATVELKITPDKGYEVTDVNSYYYMDRGVSGTFDEASDTWSFEPLFYPNRIVVTTEAEEVVTIVSGADSAATVTVQIPIEEADKVEGLNLVVEELEAEVKEDSTSLVVSKLGVEEDDVYILDIYFENEDGEETKVNTTMVVAVPVPEGWDAADVAVYYVNSETGEFVDMKAVASEDGKSVSFVTEHFSHYALVHKTAADSEEPVTDKVKTGDSSNMMLWGMLLVISTMSIVVLSKRYKER